MPTCSANKQTNWFSSDHMWFQTDFTVLVDQDRFLSLNVKNKVIHWHTTRRLLGDNSDVIGFYYISILRIVVAGFDDYVTAVLVDDFHGGKVHWQRLGT